MFEIESFFRSNQGGTTQKPQNRGEIRPAFLYNRGALANLL